MFEVEIKVVIATVTLAVRTSHTGGDAQLEMLSPWFPSLRGSARLHIHQSYSGPLPVVRWRTQTGVKPAQLRSEVASKPRKSLPGL